MFAIYNTDGRRFRDSLEALKKVHQPHQVADANFHQDIAQDETVIIQGATAGEVLENNANSKSIQTYRKMLHANERTIIVHAYQLMTHPVITIPSNMSIADAYDEFAKHQINQFPVVTPQLELIGLVTYKQVTKAYLQAPQRALTELIKNEVITADPISDVRRIAKVMYDYQLSALPIVNEHDHLVGIISKTDILKALINDPPLSLWT